ncbi:MAG: HEAT repeat domain-containing protein [Lysobacteraceae bacterium]
MPSRTPLRIEAIQGLTTPKLAELVKGPHAEPFAVGELVRRRPTDLRGILAGVVGETGHPADVRLAATVQMRNRPSLASEDALINALKAGQPIRRRALEALAISGSTRAISALSRLAEPQDPVVSRSLAFARTLLAHRHGVEPPAPLPRASLLTLDPGKARPIAIKTLPAAQWRAVEGGLDAGALPFKAAPGLTHEFECGGERLLLAFNAQASAPSGRAGLLARPSVVAALLGMEEVSGQWWVTEYILATPDDTGPGARLTGVGGNGRQRHEGTAQESSQGLVFKLSTVQGSRYPALELTGSFSGQGASAVTLQGRAEDTLRGAANLPRSPAPAVD